MPWENLNISSIADCYLDVPVIDFLKHECYISDEEFSKCLDPQRRIPDAETAIVGLKVRTTHTGEPRTYRVRKVTELGANKLTFVLEEKDKKRMTTVEEYFRTYFGYKLRFPQLNCLHVGNPSRTVYLPIEVCKIEKGQKRRNTFDSLQCFSPEVLSVGSGSFSYNFDELITERWNENNFSSAPELRYWILLNYDTQTSKEVVNIFVKNFLQVARDKGMKIEDPVAVFHSLNPSPVSDFEICKTKSSNQLQLVLCLISEMKGLYEAIKYADDYVNVTTQCIQSRNIPNSKDAMIINILIKIKAKLTSRSNDQFSPCM